jgi:TldD protein
VIGLWSVFLPVARAEDPVTLAVTTELQRARAELHLPDMPGPYHVSALVHELSELTLEASLGGLIQRTEVPTRRVGLVVRSGSETLDNTNFDAVRTGVGSVGLVQGDDVLALRKDLWWQLDVLYKQSVEALAAKEAAMRRRAEPDEVPDFVPGTPAQATAAAAPPFERAPLEELARELSSVFLTHPDIEWSTVFLQGSSGRKVVIDTGGTQVAQPVSQLVLRVVARVRASDGATAVDDVSYVVRDVAALPPREELLRQTEALAARLERWRTLPVLEEEYVGPVLFREHASVDVVRHVLIPSLLGTPAEMEAPRGSRVFTFDDEGPSGPLQLKRRLLPSGFRVTDDPRRDPHLPSSYSHDDEGVPAQRVELVTDGIVRTHLMSRIPSEAVPQSNGHGRGVPGALVRAVPSDLQVEGARARSDKALHKTALKLASEYSSSQYMVVERLREPALARFDGGPLITLTDFLDLGGEHFPEPLEVVLVDKTGERRSFRGAAVGGLDRRSLKEIVGSGETQVRTVLWGADSMDDPYTGFPVTLGVPDLLFGELVVSPSHRDAEKPPRLQSPLVGRQP